MMQPGTKLFLTVFLIYGFYVTISGPLNNVDALCVAIVDHGTFAIDPRVSGDYAVVDGVKYSGYSPGASWLLAPIYALLKAPLAALPSRARFIVFSMLAAWLLTIPLGAWCVAAMYRLLRDRQISHSAAIKASLLFAFGTMWFAYARRHNSYSLISSALIFLSFCYVERARQPSDSALGTRFRPPAAAFVAGFIAMMGVAVDYKGILAVFGLVLYILLSRNDWGKLTWFGAGALLPALSIMAYNAEIFGSPLSIPTMFQQMTFFGPGLTSLGGEQGGAIALQGILHFSGPTLGKLLVGPKTGYFLYMPILGLAFWGIVQAWRARTPFSRRVIVLAMGIFLAYLLLAAHLPFWWAGPKTNYYGPATRYLLPSVPFLMLLVAYAIEKTRHGLFWSLSVLSVMINWEFVLSAGYGRGMSPIVSGWTNLPFVVHARHIAATFGGESVWFNVLTSSHFAMSKAAAALVTWLGAALVGILVYSIWRLPTGLTPASTAK